MISESEHHAVVDFLYREARLADEGRYAEWEALWTDDGVYWVPGSTDPAADPDRHLSHVYDNRSRIATLRSSRCLNLSTDSLSSYGSEAALKSRVQ